MNIAEAKSALDKIIQKSRIHLYKPIQVAEILYRFRIGQLSDLMDLESYRSASKRWRDEISRDLLGTVCTSSCKFQDNLFDDNAVPPRVLKTLGVDNNARNGAVEAYIYRRFDNKHGQLQAILDYCEDSTPATFEVQRVIDSFWNEPGLKRSLDKVYEIIVYSLFITIIDALELRVSLEINPTKRDLLTEFQDFTQKVMQLDLLHPSSSRSAKVFRVGITNAADRGLDMYSNWGPAIQIKHLTLDEDLASSIVGEIQSDRIIIVCKDVERKVLISVLNQIGWASRIQSIVTEEDLRVWYHKALCGQYSPQMGPALLQTFAEQMQLEFPSVGGASTAIDERHYERIADAYWR